LNMLKLREYKLQVPIINAYPLPPQFPCTHFVITIISHQLPSPWPYACLHNILNKNKILGHAHVYVTTSGIL
jgi:hypothetical protein